MKRLRRAFDPIRLSTAQLYQLVIIRIPDTRLIGCGGLLLIAGGDGR